MPGLLFSGGIDSVIASGRIATTGSFLWQNGPTPSVSGFGTTAVLLTFPTGAGVKTNKGALFVQCHGTSAALQATTEGGEASLDGLKFTVNFSATGGEFTFLLLSTALPTP